MKIKIRYENHFTTFDLKLEEINAWLNIDILPDETEEAFQERVQEKVDEDYNRPEYNVMHKQERHKGYAISARDENGEETLDFEPNMHEVKDSSIFFQTQKQMDTREKYEAVKKFVYSELKPSVADLVMDVWINEMEINEKAKSMLSREAFATEAEYKKAVARLANNITHKLIRARNKLEKNIKKASDFGLSRGYKVGGTNSSRKNDRR